MLPKMIVLMWNHMINIDIHLFHGHLYGVEILLKTG